MNNAPFYFHGLVKKPIRQLMKSKKKKTISLVWTRKKDGRRTNPKKGSRMDPP